MRHQSCLSVAVSAAIVAAVGFTSCTGGASLPSDGTFYVSPTGKDQGAGTEARPWKTLSYALKTAAEVRGESQTPLKIVLKGGEYFMSETIRLEGQDNVSIVAAEGEIPVLAGDRYIRGWKLLKDGKVLARLPEASRGRVWQASLDKSGVGEVGMIIGDTNRVDLYFNGKRQQLSRWPNEGNATAGNVIGTTPTRHSHWHGFNEGVFEYLEDNIDRWADEPDAYAHGYWFWDWRENYKKIVKVDPETRTIHLPEGDDDYYGYKDHLRYFGVNLLCEMDVEGEYYVNPSDKLVYYLAPEDFDPKGTQVTYAAFGTKYMLAVKDCANILIDGITFRGGRNGAVSATGDRNLTIRDCRFAQFGDDVMYLADGKDCIVEGCLFQELGHGGIEAYGGDRKTLEPSGYVVENTIFSDFSLYKPTYEPAIIFYGCGMDIRHNHFQNCASSALRLEGNDILVEKNRFVNLVTESDDQGAIDVYNNISYRGNIVRYNWWQDIVSDAESGAAAIRLDDIISGYKIYGNVFNHCGGGYFGAVQIHGGKDNIVENNLMFDCYKAVSASPWSDEHFKEEYQDMAPRIAEVDFPSPLYKERYPELNEDVFINHNRNIIRDNLAVNPTNRMGQRPYYVVVNNPEIDSDKPIECFLDPAVLRGYGLDPIPYEDMGLTDNRYKDLVPLK